MKPRQGVNLVQVASLALAFVAGAVVISVINKQGYRLVGGAANGASISDLAALQLAAPIPTKAEPACAARSLTPRQRECLARGEAFKANLPGGGARNGPHPFDVPFVSPITTARDNVFFDFAAHTPTDKITSHAYHYLYNRYLAHSRLHDLNMLEIGLGCDMNYGPGASLKLWRALLPCSNISFIEYNAECANNYKAEVETEGGGRLYIGSQDDPKLLAQIAADAQAAGGFDMIVDDGSHGPSHIFATLTALWPTIKPGGVYIVEDLGLHWWPNRGAKWTEYSLDAPAPLAVPLYQRLIHTINCLTTTMTPHYSEDYIAWCRKEQANSIFRDVINVDCMPEACALVKGRPLAGL